MRVLFISGGDAKYGAPKAMMALITALKNEYGVEPILLTKKYNELNEYCDNMGIENYACWYRDIMAGSPYSNIFFTMLKHFLKYIFFLFGGIYKYKINRIGIDFKTIDLIHTNINRVDIGAYIAKRYHIAHVWHIREMGQEDYNVRFYKRKCIEYMNSNADAFITISEIVSKKWISQGINVFKINRIYDGIKLESIIKKDTEDLDKIEIVVVGHVQPNKGQLQIVKALAVLPDALRAKVSLDIIGEAYHDYRIQIENEIDMAKLNNQVRLLGYRDNIGGILKNYDIGFNGSKSEGFGLCTIEYMMAGLFTIASDTGANVELVKNGVNGFLYKYDNIVDLSEKIVWCIKEKKIRKEIARAGCIEARNKFSEHNCAKNVYEVYKKCLKKI